jgi:cell wall-associated NlpC family hydrolase
MRYLSLFLVLFLCFTSCKSSKLNSKKNSAKVEKKKTTTVDRVIDNALSFQGTKYKYGGTTKKGMDCSGLIYVAFKNEDIMLPRVSRVMATKGKRVKQGDVKKGDLIFFKTKKKSGSINHVGLVVSTYENNIEFIHSTTSKGVITSSLSESYWKNAYREIRRVL